MSVDSSPMTRLIVRLHPNRDVRPLRGYRRLSADELHRVKEANRAYVTSCWQEFKDRIPAEATVEPLDNLNALVVSCPNWAAEQVRREIVHSCKRVAAITEDSPMHLIQPEQADPGV